MRAENCVFSYDCLLGCVCAILSVKKNEAVHLYDASRAEVFSHIAHLSYSEAMAQRTQEYLFAEKNVQTFVVQ